MSKICYINAYNIKEALAGVNSVEQLIHMVLKKVRGQREVHIHWIFYYSYIFVWNKD